MAKKPKLPPLRSSSATPPVSTPPVSTQLGTPLGAQPAASSLAQPSAFVPSSMSSIVEPSMTDEVSARIQKMHSTRSTLGSSDLRDIDICDRMYVLRHLEHYVPIITSTTKLLGSLIHLGLKYWYAQFLEVTPEWFQSTTMFDALDAAGRGHPAVIEHTKLILGRYVHKWGVIDRAWRDVRVETEYTVKLDDLNVSGAFDMFPVEDIELLYRRGETPTARADFAAIAPSGRSHWMDYKSTGFDLYGVKPDATKYALNWQFLMYQWIAAHTRDSTGQRVFPTLGSWIVQRIQTKEPYESDRIEVDFPPGAFAEVPEAILRRMIKRAKLREAVARGEPASPSYGACSMWGDCDFAPVCKAVNRQAVLNTRYIIDR